MSGDVYRTLAQRLDAIPNGFPATDSGVELRLLAKMYTPEEAALAAVMRLTPESSADISARAGADPGRAQQVLEDMARRNLIGMQSREGQSLFRLIPFMVGIYEGQLGRIDAEFAALFEAYYQESQGIVVRDGPAVHRVIPVGEAIPFEVEIFPYERASELIEDAKSWGVRDCVCRVQQKLVGKGCDRPIEICLVFAPLEGAFDDSDVDRAITKEEALQVLREAGEAGLVHSTANRREGTGYICNCCTCCCGIMRGVAEFGIPTAIAHSDFRAAVDQDACVGCGTCVGRCQFGALSVPEYVCVVDHARCVGCGLCVTACPNDALGLERRPEEEVLIPPADGQEWMARRAQERGISMGDIV